MVISMGVAISRLALLALVGVCAIQSASASEMPSWRTCAREASQTYSVPLVVLTLVYDMEGGRLGAETPNRDKDGKLVSRHRPIPCSPASNRARSGPVFLRHR